LYTLEVSQLNTRDIQQVHTIRTKYEVGGGGGCNHIVQGEWVKQKRAHGET